MKKNPYLLSWLCNTLLYNEHFTLCIYECYCWCSLGCISFLIGLDTRIWGVLHACFLIASL